MSKIRKIFRSILPCKCPCPPKFVIPNIEQWLNANPTILNSIIWEAPMMVETQYVNWSNVKKNELQIACEHWFVGDSPALEDPPPNLINIADDDFCYTIIDEAHTWSLYLAYIANSLMVEIFYKGFLQSTGGVSLRDLSSESLAIIFNSQKMFRWNHWDDNGYSFAHYYVIPAPPKTTLQFLNQLVPEGQTILTIDKSLQITILLDWCRQNLTHTSSDWDYNDPRNGKRTDEIFHYRGTPPVSRIIEGTIDDFPFNTRNGVQNYTHGCWCTVGFLQAVLRSVNNPVELVDHCLHAQPYFHTIGKYLDHGDTPYSALSCATPNFDISHLLIDQTTFDSWFGLGVSEEDKCSNIGRRAKEIAVQFLPDSLVRLHCDDLDSGTHPAESAVCIFFQDYFTFEELDAQLLWQRLDAKVADFGGCENIPNCWCLARDMDC